MEPGFDTQSGVARLTKARRVAKRPRDPRRAQRRARAGIRTMQVKTTRGPLPWKISAKARETARGCFNRRSIKSVGVTMSVCKYSNNARPVRRMAAPPQLQRQASSARKIEGWRQMARKPSRTGAGEGKGCLMAESKRRELGVRLRLQG